ncbi:hypothetical protein WDW89_12650 [Deltaproteobacteria bacterium TL4]
MKNPRYFLTLTFKVLTPIKSLPHYQGALWSAMLRFAYNPFLVPGKWPMGSLVSNTLPLSEYAQ